MAKIPLRSYFREIDSLIERGMNEEAVAHCRFILKYYPKSIETYRLLSKAFLESQRYSEAADILQRILSVAPDDFFALIGMSITREDEGNLDAAIFYMERAYETQPANVAVQDELRRLYGRRDGVEPPKLRLSRGALVRMYYKGGLNRQAIAEINTALKEDAQRTDLEVILAKIHMDMGEKIPAFEVASRILAKLPYCYDALQIMVNILPTTVLAEDTQKYIDRLISLDPYIAFISTTYPTVQQVPDNAVVIDRLDWQGTSTEALPPAWAQTIGVTVEPEPSEATPDWLEEMTSQEKTPEITIEPQPEESPSTIIPPAAEPAASTIPDWMQQAGWSISEGTAVEPSQPFEAEEGEEESLEAAKAEIPDWLKELAPDESQLSEESIPEDQERLNLLEQILPSVEASAIESSSEMTTSPIESDESIAIPAEAEEMPSYLEFLATSPSVEQQEEAQGGISEEIQAAVEPSIEIQLDEALSTEPVEATTESIPEWIANLTALEPAAEQPAEAVNLPEEPQGDKELPQAEAVQPIPAEEISEEPLPDWIRELSAAEEGQQEPLEALPPTQEVALPEIVAESVESTVIPGLEEEPSASAEIETVLEELQVEPSASAEMETVLEELPEEPSASEEIEPVLEEQQKEPSVSAEMETVISEELVEGILPSQSLEEMPSVEPEEIIASSEANAVQPVIPVEEPEVETTPAAQAESELAEQATSEPATSEMALPDFSDADAAMAWLEALAAKQGAAEETLIIPPEDRHETPPEWIQALTAASADQSTAAEETPELPPLPAEAAQEAQAGEEKFGEFAGDFNEFAVPEEVAYTELTPSEAEKAEPEPLALSEEPEVIETAPSADASKEMDFDTAFAWLESLAAQQGAPEETLLTPAEDRATAAPVIFEEKPSQEEAASPTQPVKIFSEMPAEKKEPEPIPPLPSAETSEPVVISQPGASQEEELVSTIEPVETPTTEEPETPMPTPPLIVEEVKHTSQLGPLPAWLQGDSGEGVPEVAPSTESVTPELPDWLKGLESVVENPPETQAVSEALPEWLSDIEQSQEQPPLEQQVVDAEQAPDWIQGIADAEEQKNAETSGVLTQEDLQKFDELEAIPAGTESPQLLLNAAQSALAGGKVELAMRYYTRLIQSNSLIEETIHDLRDALYRYPVDISIWQTLGDAYLRNNQIQDALDAYTKAEEFLR